jgi:hypothetical protein
MLAEAIGQLLETETHVLEADFLGDREHRHRREQAVRGAQQPCEHGAVAHAGVEYVQRRRGRAHVLEFLGGATRDRGLLVAGIDEREVFLPVVVEAERGRRCRLGRCAAGLSQSPEPLVRDIHAVSPVCAPKSSSGARSLWKSTARLACHACWSSDHIGFDQGLSREVALVTQRREIERAVAAVHDPLGEAAADGRRLLQAMTAEAARDQQVAPRAERCR